MTYSFKPFLLVLFCAFISCNVDEDANKNNEDNNFNTVNEVPEEPNDNTPLTATYTVEFIGEWTAESHPNMFPNDDHFSKTILLTHNANVTLFTEGELASTGIEDMSEIGDNDNLEVEMQTLISAGEANQYKIGPASIPGNGTDLLTVEATQNFSKLSYVAMIAPSPDWFSGVSSVSLFENGSWVNTVEIDVKAYDAGTENGNTFSYDNVETIPQQPITQISDAPLGDGTTVSPRLGYLRITLQE